jgi:hypothetical protein
VSSYSASGPPSVGAEAKLAESRAYLRRLERLVRIILDKKLSGAEQLWQIQRDLLKLQRDIQDDIGGVKKTPRNDRSREPSLGQLRQALWHARRFGDTIAWLVFNLDRKLMYPLARNYRVPVGSDDHGGHGVEIIAEVLANDGWGFPILHDITDILRIGDITFVKAGQPPRTVEVKTRLVDKSPAEDGKTVVTYKITILTASDFPHDSRIPGAGGDQLVGDPPATTISLTPRLERQLKRLGDAKFHQDSLPDVLLNADTAPHVSTQASLGHAPHWPIIRRLIRRARRSGYASESADNNFLYLAFYGKDGIDLNAINERLTEDVRSSTILSEDKTVTNSLHITAIPPADHRGPLLFLPYYLYSIPKTSVLDLLHGRLMIFVLTNPGKLAKSLEGSGHGLRVRTDGRLYEGQFAVTTTIEDNGGQYKIDLRRLDLHIREMIHEFHGVRYLIDVALAMRNAASIAIRAINEGDGNGDNSGGTMMLSR